MTSPFPDESARRATGEHRAVRRHATGEHRAVAADGPQIERLLRQALDIVESARTMPMSSSIKLDRDEIVGLLQECVDRLPDELRAARWLLKERDDVLARARREGDEIVQLAAGRAGRMVEKTEIVKAAEVKARKIVDAAERDARRLRLEAEDFCDQRLARFESMLEKTLHIVTEGRAKLAGSPLDSLAPPEAIDEVEEDFFDQDNAAR